MQNPGSVFFFLFPVVCELYRAPVGDVALFSFAKHAVEHSCRTQQANVAAVQGRERPAPDIPPLGEKDAACLAVCRGTWQQVLHFIEWNPRIGERDWPGLWNLIPDCTRDRKSTRLNSSHG